MTINPYLFLSLDHLIRKRLAYKKLIKTVLSLKQILSIQIFRRKILLFLKI